ncbi:hypothetical protein ABZ901_18960, partial [Actinacidiphila alni]
MSARTVPLSSTGTRYGAYAADHRAAVAAGGDNTRVDTRAERERMEAASTSSEPRPPAGPQDGGGPEPAGGGTAHGAGPAPSARSEERG